MELSILFRALVCVRPPIPSHACPVSHVLSFLGRLGASMSHLCVLCFVWAFHLLLSICFLATPPYLTLDQKCSSVCKFRVGKKNKQKPNDFVELLVCLLQVLYVFFAKILPNLVIHPKFCQSLPLIYFGLRLVLT